MVVRNALCFPSAFQFFTMLPLLLPPFLLWRQWATAQFPESPPCSKIQCNIDQNDQAEQYVIAEEISANLWRQSVQDTTLINGKRNSHHLNLIFETNVVDDYCTFYVGFCTLCVCEYKPVKTENIGDCEQKHPI